MNFIKTLNIETMTNTREIFDGISTSELLNYRAMGDNSKELDEEINRRGRFEVKRRKGTTNITEMAAKNTGFTDTVTTYVRN